MTLLARHIGTMLPKLIPVVETKSNFIRSFHVSTMMMADKKFRMGTSKVSLSELRGSNLDESGTEAVNIDALAAAEQAQDTKFKLFPDEDTLDEIFDGVKYKDLPYVTIICAMNNTKFWFNEPGSDIRLRYSPRVCGFKNAAKRTNVAAQVAGMNFGQILRNRSVDTIKVRINGFNQGRIAAVKGIVQAGLRVVSVSDVTTVDWGYSQRPKKRKRQN